MAMMKVKGTTLMSRRRMFGERLGSSVYDAFVDEFARTHPAFPQPILPTTLIPVDVFLQFNDALINRFFGGDVKIFELIGELSADYFAKEGPYVASFYRGDYMKFWSMLPVVWKTLYTEGEARATAEGNTLDVEIDCPVAHLYFEHSTIAFVRRGLEVKAGRKVVTTRIAGLSDGRKHIHYRFQLPAT